MPPVRNVPPKTERTHEENQERAYIAASRRSDRSLEARIESAKRASEIHKKRTGNALRITEDSVANEEMYEEEDGFDPGFASLGSSSLAQRSMANLQFHYNMRNLARNAYSERNANLLCRQDFGFHPYARPPPPQNSALVQQQQQQRYQIAQQNFQAAQPRIHYPIQPAFQMAPSPQPSHYSTPMNMQMPQVAQQAYPQAPQSPFAFQQPHQMAHQNQAPASQDHRAASAQQVSPQVPNSYRRVEHVPQDYRAASAQQPSPQFPNSRQQAPSAQQASPHFPNSHQQSQLSLRLHLEMDSNPHSPSTPGSILASPSGEPGSTMLNSQNNGSRKLPVPSGASVLSPLYHTDSPMAERSPIGGAPLHMTSSAESVTQLTEAGPSSFHDIMPTTEQNNMPGNEFWNTLPFSTTLPPESQQLMNPLYDFNDPSTSALMSGSDQLAQPLTHGYQQEPALRPPCSSVVDSNMAQMLSPNMNGHRNPALEDSLAYTPYLADPMNPSYLQNEEFGQTRSGHLDDINWAIDPQGQQEYTV